MQEYDKFSSGKFIMSHKSQGPMKMQEKGGCCRENWVIEAGGPMSNQRNGFGAVLKIFCQTKMETQSCKYGFIF